MEISYQRELLRKSVHLSSLWMAAVIYFCPRLFCVILFGVMCLLNILVEYAYYKKLPVITPLYGFFFGKMLRESHGNFRLSGSPPFLAAACLTVLFFDRPIALIAFLTMMFGDTAAALIGRRFGRTRFKNGKSLEGCLAFFVAGCLIVAAGCFFQNLPLKVMLLGFAGVVPAMIAELFSSELHLDDNLTVPLILGGVMTLSRFL